MISRKKLFILLPYLFSCVSPKYYYKEAAKAEEKEVIKTEKIELEGEIFYADNPMIQYSGRIDFSKPKEARFDWPGVTILASFEGTSCTIVLKDSDNVYNIYVDGNLVTKLFCDPEKEFYPVVNGLKDGKHTILITKRTESSFGTAVFKGLILDKGKKLLDPPKKPERKIEFIGDSFTCGYGNESYFVKCPSLRQYENNYEAFGPLAARELNAEYHVIAISGKGMVRNYGDKNKTSNDPLPYYYQRTIQKEEGLKWNFKKWIPDAVVIALGANDFSTEPHPDPETYITAYKKFIKFIRKQYGDIHIFAICTRISYPFYKESVEKVVQEVNAEGDKKVFYVEFPDLQDNELGCDYHPNINAHKKFAKILVPIIKEKLNW